MKNCMIPTGQVELSKLSVEVSLESISKIENMILIYDSYFLSLPVLLFFFCLIVFQATYWLEALFAWNY